VRVLVGISILFWAGTAIVMALVAVMAVDRFDGDLGLKSFIAGFFGVGMLAGSLSLMLLNSRIGAELIAVGSMAATGLSLLALAGALNVPWAVVAALATGYFGGMLMVVINTELQRFSPDRLRGRVFGAKAMAETIGHVIVAGLIWRSPDADDSMLAVTLFLAAAMILLAVAGFRRYVLHGPNPSRLLNMLWRIDRLYAYGFHRLKVSGRHHVPSSGPVLLVSNHTAGLDPALIQAAIARPVRWMMAREYMLGGLGWLWRVLQPIPVQRQGRDSTAVRAAVRALQAGEVVASFPEGGISRDRTQLRSFHRGVGAIAALSDAPIVPVFIEGTPGVKRTLTSYLVRGDCRVHFGAPCRWRELLAEVTEDRNEMHRQIAEEIRHRIEAMREEATAQRSR
jgi:1-acyl-sn-glycerol-3-phosphate acyltransferase